MVSEIGKRVEMINDEIREQQVNELLDQINTIIEDIEGMSILDNIAEAFRNAAEELQDIVDGE